jgi:hypothetical protein
MGQCTGVAAEEDGLGLEDEKDAPGLRAGNMHTATLHQ